MNRALVDRIANAVLYEGYIRYPYRPSVKNRQRWTFGGLYPEAYCQAQGGEAATSQTECLVCGNPATTFTAVVRFLHLTDRRVGAFDPPLAAWPDRAESPARPVETLRVGDKLFQAWLDLAYALCDGYEAVVLVAAAPRGGRPGTLYVVEPARITPPEPDDGGVLVEGHGMDPVKVLRLAAALGGQVKWLLPVGCEPAPPAGVDDMQMGLSEAVRAAVDAAVPLVEALVARLLRGEDLGGGIGRYNF